MKQEQQRVTTKDPKKVEAGKRLAAINHKKREVKKREAKKREAKRREAKKREEVQYGGMNQYYGIGAILAVGVIGGLGYYIYQTKKGEVPDRALQAPAGPCSVESSSATIKPPD